LPAPAHQQFASDPKKIKYMNADLVKQAMEKVQNAHVLINMVSRRVRQLNSGNGGACRPLIARVENLNVADIALREIIEDKMSFEMPEIIKLTRPTAQNRNQPQGWRKPQTIKDKPIKEKIAA
jgi:DNA-directed RNA polymerase subunit omega